MSIPSNRPTNLCVVYLNGEDQIVTGNPKPAPSGGDNGGGR
jgi:hypothetical protein